MASKMTVVPHQCEGFFEICITRGHCDSRYGGYDTERYLHILAGQTLQ